jgi:hypothetical protein
MGPKIPDQTSLRLLSRPIDRAACIPERGRPLPGADTLTSDDISTSVMPAVGHALWGLPNTRRADRSSSSAYRSSFGFPEVPAAMTVRPAAL